MWHLIENGNQLPDNFTTEQVIEHMTANPGGTFMVWKSGMQGWTDPKTMADFKVAAPKPTAPAPQAAAPQPAAPQPIAAQPIAAQPIAAQPIAAQPNVAQPAAKSANAFFNNAADKLKQIHEGDSTYAFLPHLGWIDGILGWFGDKVPSDKLDSFDEFAKKWGNVGLLISVVAVLIFGIMQGIKIGGFGGAMMQSVITMLALLIIQYIAIKFLDAGKALIKKSPTHLSSRSFLDCVGLVVLLLIPASFVFGVIGAIRTKSFLPFAIGLGATVLLVYVLSVTMRPKTVNVTVAGEASAGQEAIAIMSFFMKLILRMVPLVFGIVNILAPFALLFFAAALAFSSSPYIYVMQGTTVVGAIFGAALFPLTAYLVFLIFYLLIDLIQSVLEIPGKISELKEIKKN